MSRSPRRAGGGGFPRHSRAEPWEPAVARPELDIASKKQPDQVPPDLATAKIERERAATELYGVSRGAAPERHQELERAYNRANARVHALQGREGPYRYQRDAREDFRFDERVSVGARGQRIRTIHAKGELSDPDTVVNWRNTEVGARHDKRLREGISYKTGDDAGHIVACKFGVDPAERRNISRQNPSQNQAGGNYYAMEQRADQHCRQGPDHRVQLNVREHFHADRYGNRRPLVRVAELQYGRTEGAHFKQERSEEPLHLNMQDYPMIKRRTGQHPPRPATPGSVHSMSDDKARRLARIRDEAQAKQRVEARDKAPTKKT